MRDLPAPATSVRWRWSFATAACGATPSAPASSTRHTGARRSASSLRSACRHRSRSTPLSALHCSRPREPSRDSSVRAPGGRVRTEQEQESAAPSREGEARLAAGKASHARPTSRHSSPPRRTSLRRRAGSGSPTTSPRRVPTLPALPIELCSSDLPCEPPPPCRFSGRPLPPLGRLQLRHRIARLRRRRL